MRSLSVTLIAMLVSCTSFATTIKAVANGFWESTTSWNLGRLPQDNDTIIIPAGYTITLDVNVSYNRAVVEIYGILSFTNGKLRLDNNSSVTIESGGKITGINSNDQITIGSTLKYSGNDGTLTGYAVANSSTGSDPYGFATVLPVTFQSFYVIRQNADVFISWATSEETNNSYYAIERSTDAVTWKQIGAIAGAGTSNLINKYNYTDGNVTGTAVYYRIRQEDFNGTIHYSTVRMVTDNSAAPVTNIYASSKQTITIDCNGAVRNNIIIQVVNISGQIIKSCSYQTAPSRLTLNIPEGNCMYVVRITDGKSWNVVRKIQ